MKNIDKPHKVIPEDHPDWKAFSNQAHNGVLFTNFAYKGTDEKMQEAAKNGRIRQFETSPSFSPSLFLPLSHPHGFTRTHSHTFTHLLSVMRVGRQYEPVIFSWGGSSSR